MQSAEELQDHALGCSRGGLTTKIHMLCNANGMPLRFLLSGGQTSDIAYAQPLLDEAYIPSLRGRPRKRCRWLLAEKGYDAEALRRYWSLLNATGNPVVQHEAQTQAGFAQTV